MRILITGGEGQLGRALVRALEGHDVLALGRARLDVADERATYDAIGEARPDVVVHTAALTDTTRCESDPAAAEAVNALGARNVARACAAAGAMLIAVSTNEVFDGAQATPYAEDAAPNPVNAYGHSKLEGERQAQREHRNTLIARTAWLYGDGAQNFVSKVLAAARAGRPLRFVTDEVATPTSADDLAHAIRGLIERQARPGIYHLTNAAAAPRYDWAREILRLAGMADAAVEPITTAELRARGYDGPRKPPYSVLANTRARALGITLPDWREALAAHFARTHGAAPQSVRNQA